MLSSALPFIRKLIFIISFILIPIFASCQITQGTWAVGGSARFSFENSESDLTPLLFNNPSINRIFTDTTTVDLEITQWDVVPQVGYFVNDRWLISAILGYQFEKISFPDQNNEAKVYLFNLGASLRRYIILNEAGTGGLTATMSFLFQVGDTEFTIDNIEEDGPAISTFAPFIDLGFFYFVTPHFALEANWFVLGYKIVQNNDNKNDRLRFSTGLGLNDLSIGARWYFYK